ncbi:MAG: AAA family ATPase [Ignavibacteriales bacterium]|nr:AAA family ATPase [Ignavibacteriales bacterium]
MRYKKFTIQNYRGITNPLAIDVGENSLIPIIGINECGKTTILQAIYCFDFINDKEYKEKHITNTLNLYQTSDANPPLISASIELKVKELEKVFEEFNQSEVKKVEESKKTGKNYIPKSVNSNELINQFSDSIEIQRDLTTLEYSVISPNVEIPNAVIKEIIRHAPYILYNDDFMDRPPNTIDIPDEKPDSLKDWLAIFERLFNATNPNYSLFSLIQEDDERRRLSIISDVEEVLNKKLSKAWKTFLLSNHGALYVKLILRRNEKPIKLEIQIIEKMGKRERFFDVADRSKGFLWFFNFVMKLEFNPKVVGNTKDTIFLLDEPGSYLHSTAQEKLCNKIKEISEKSGVVIYCTHSHHLLNPDFIPLNKVYIVEKEREKNIKATPLPQIKFKKDNLNAYQPIHDALQIPSFDLYDSTSKIVAVEGIYDKYSIQLFCEINNHIVILPGTNADSIVKNIQYLNGFSRIYTAIWDNDAEGRDKLEKARKIFGDIESEKFDKLPAKGLSDRKMEQMYENNDLEKISLLLDLPKEANYEKIISMLFFSKKSKIEKAKSLLSKETKENFSILSDIIKKRLKIAEELNQISLEK